MFGMVEFLQTGHPDEEEKGILGGMSSMVKEYVLWMLILLQVLSGSAMAQGVNPGALENELNALKAKVSELEARLQLYRTEAPQEKIDELDQQIRILQRQRELDKEETEAKEKKLPVLNVGAKGFSIASPEEDFLLRFRGYLQADGRFYPDDDENALDDTFTLRRIRPILEGTIWEHYNFRIMPDFGGGETELFDAYIEMTHFPEASLRVGKFKVPFGLERLQSATSLMFLERGFPTSLGPNRDVGIQLSGEFREGLLSYAVGVFNGVADWGSSDLDLDDGKQVAARIFTHPFISSDIEALQGLGIGLAGTYGDSEGDVSSFRSSGRQRFFRYRDGTQANGRHHRFSPQGYYYWGPFGLMGEYVLSTQDLEREGINREVDNEAWQVQVSYVLTGEDASYKGVKPAKPFDPRKGTWGAFELVARYGNLELDNDIYGYGFADSAVAADEADEYALGLNWYLNNNVQYKLDYVHTSYSGGDVNGDRESEDAVMTRFQLSF
jgi:phosphate-selective porin OprO/OprP